MPNGERVIGYSVIDDYFLRREGNMVDSGDYTYDMPLTPYPERNDKRVSELEYTVDWLVEALRHFERWAMLLEARTEILENLVKHEDAWLTAVDERLVHIEALLHKALNPEGNHDD